MEGIRGLSKPLECKLTHWVLSRQMSVRRIVKVCISFLAPIRVHECRHAYRKMEAKALRSQVDSCGQCAKIFGSLLARICVVKALMRSVTQAAPCDMSVLLMCRRAHSVVMAARYAT